VPRVEREEFLNVGVIVYCPAQRFLQTLYQLNEDRLDAFSCKMNIDELDQRLRAFEQICAGAADGGTIGKLPIASRFRWLTAARSTIIQTSPVHPGLCMNASQTLISLYNKLVQ